MLNAVYEEGMESLLMELLLTAKQRKLASVSMDRRAETATDHGRIHLSLEVRFCKNIRGMDKFRLLRKYTIMNKPF